VEAR